MIVSVLFNLSRYKEGVALKVNLDSVSISSDSKKPTDNPAPPSEPPEHLQIDSNSYDIYPTGNSNGSSPITADPLADSDSDASVPVLDAEVKTEALALSTPPSPKRTRRAVQSAVAGLKSTSLKKRKQNKSHQPSLKNELNEEPYEAEDEAVNDKELNWEPETVASNLSDSEDCQQEGVDLNWGTVQAPKGLQHPSAPPLSQKKPSRPARKRNEKGSKPKPSTYKGIQTSSGNTKRPYRKLRKGFQFQCTTCEYKTGHRNTFVKHLRVHTGERPYLCTQPGCDR